MLRPKVRNLALKFLFGYDMKTFAHLDFFNLEFGDLPPFFSADPLKLRQVGQGLLMDSHFQVTPEMFDWVQVRALAWPLKDIHRVVPKPLLRCLGCVQGHRPVGRWTFGPVWSPEHSGQGFH